MTIRNFFAGMSLLRRYFADADLDVPAWGCEACTFFINLPIPVTPEDEKRLLALGWRVHDSKLQWSADNY
jgi:hypothetical protein